jgi:transposase
MKETLTLTKAEQHRLLVIGKVDRGEVTAAQAAEVLQRSVRQVRRILAAYRQEGAASLAHGNRDRNPVHTIPDHVRQRVVELAQTRYAGLNDTHLTEKLAEPEGIFLSRSTVRRIRREAGLASPRTRRAPQHRSRRERMPQAGLLVQWDGSHHAWLEERGPRLVLLAAIDDATGAVLAAHFRAQEDAHGYLQLLAELVTEHGVPLAVYHDRHSIFRQNTPETIAEQLRGERALTQVGRALAELGITAIAAGSPQAKGRIVRLFGTLQDRLVAELRLAEVRTLQDANCFLTGYLARFNAQFRVPAANPEVAFRPLAPEQEVAAICGFKYQRTVALDNTVSLGEHRLQLLPGKTRVSYARAEVEVQERLDGSLHVIYQDELVAHQSAPVEAPLLRARSGRRPAPRPMPDGLDEPAREDLAVVVEGVGLWAGAAAAVHKSTPRSPASDHPWRTGYKPEVTKSPTS